MGEVGRSDHVATMKILAYSLRWKATGDLNQRDIIWFMPSKELSDYYLPLILFPFSYPASLSFSSESRSSSGNDYPLNLMKSC